MASKKLVTRTLTLPDGTRKYFRAKTIKEAERKVHEAQVQLNGGIDLSNNMTFAELAQQWFDIYKTGALHDRSLETIKGVLNRYVLPSLGAMRVKAIRPIHIQALMNSVSHLSQSTQRKVVNVVNPIFRSAIDNGLITKSPVTSDVKAGGAKPTETPPLTQSQMAALLSATEGTKIYPFLLLCLYGGLRRGEALGVKWADFDFDAGVLTVDRSIVHLMSPRRTEVNEDMKTAQAHRTIPLPLPVLVWFRQAEEDSKSDWVLAMGNGEPWSESAFSNAWGAISRRTLHHDETDEKAKVPRTLDFHVHPHQLRHTCVTNWVQQGLDLKTVQYLAGHATLDMTLSVYTHFQVEERMSDVVKQIQGQTPNPSVELELSKREKREEKVRAL